MCCSDPLEALDNIPKEYVSLIQREVYSHKEKYKVEMSRDDIKHEVFCPKIRKWIEDFNIYRQAFSMACKCFVKLQQVTTSDVEFCREYRRILNFETKHFRIATRCISNFNKTKKVFQISKDELASLLNDWLSLLQQHCKIFKDDINKIKSLLESITNDSQGTRQNEKKNQKISQKN